MSKANEILACVQTLYNNAGTGNTIYLEINNLIQSLIAENEKLKSDNLERGDIIKQSYDAFKDIKGFVKEDGEFDYGVIVQEIEKLKSDLRESQKVGSTMYDNVARLSNDVEKLKSENDIANSKYFSQLQANDSLRNDNSKLLNDTRCLKKYKVIGALIPAKDGESHFVTMENFIKKHTATERESGWYAVQVKTESLRKPMYYNYFANGWSVTETAAHFIDSNCLSYISPTPINLEG